jgi:hypothetical protein
MYINPPMPHGRTGCGKFIEMGNRKPHEAAHNNKKQGAA